MSNTAADFGLFRIERDGGSAIELPRRGYLCDHDPRTPMRGRLFGWMYQSNAWLVISVLYLGVALPAAVDTHDVLVRVAFCVAVQFNLWISDLFHNDDLCPGGPTRAGELHAYRLDQVGIAAVQHSWSVLWAKRLFYGGGVPDALLISAAAALGVVLVNLMLCTPALLDKDEATFYRLFERYSMASKALLGLQFVGGIGGVVYTACHVAPPMAHLGLGPAAVFCVYFPGLIMFVTPQSVDRVLVPFCGGMGRHEIFHLCCLGGYITTLVLDTQLW